MNNDRHADLQTSAAGAGSATPPSPLAALLGLFRTRGVWALGDQAVVSLGNCLTGIVLASHLPADDYGVFVLVFGVLIFLNSLHQSLVTYPLSVRGAVSDADNLRRLAGHSLLFTLVLALPLSLGIVIIAGVEGRWSLVPWALAAMFLWQLQETLRRGIMAHLRHREAVLGDALSYLGQAGLLWLLWRRGSLTLETAFMAIALTSLLAVVLQGFQLRPAVSPTGEHVPALLRDYWSLGRWVLLTNFMTIVTVQAMPWTLAYFHGNASVAEFGVLALIMGPTNPIVISMAGLIVPAVAATAAAGGVGAAGRAGVRYGALGGVMLLPYYALILVVPELVIRIFTKNNPAYADLATPLRLFVLAYVIVFPGQVLRSMLEGLGRTRAAFVAQCAFSAATLLISLPLAARYGLAGAVWAGLFPAAAYVLVSGLMLRKVAAEARGGGGGGAASVPVAAPPPAPQTTPATHNGKPVAAAAAVVGEPEGAVA